jgi:hypothetical protein
MVSFNPNLYYKGEIGGETPQNVPILLLTGGNSCCWEITIFSGLYFRYIPFVRRYNEYFRRGKIMKLYINISLQEVLSWQK